MVKTLEKGEDKIQKICDALRKETLEPAKREAEALIEEAKARAEHIIKEAHHQADKIHDQAKRAIEQETNVFHSSLEQAGKQALEELRQAVEHKLFSEELHKALEKQAADPKVIARLIESIVGAIQKEGIATELSALIPKVVSAKEVNALLGDGILKRLREKSVVLDEFEGGAKVKLVDKKMTIDISEGALVELLESYVRKDFRKLIFKT